MNNKIDTDREIFTKVWNAYKTYGKPKTDEEWEKLLCVMREIRNTYDTRLAADLIQAVLMESERCYRGK